MRTSIKSRVAKAATALGLVVAAGYAVPAMADEAAPPSDFKVTGSAGVISQYRFRGISQSNNLPAVQGALTLSHSSGFYVSTWGSSASPSPAVNIGGTEIDVYGGFTHGIANSGVTFDVGLYGYIYPGAPGLNFYEVYGSLSKAIGPVNAKAGINFAPHQKNLDVYATRTDTYVYGELSGAIPNTPFTIHTHLGHTGGAFNYTKEYIDFTAGVSTTWKNLTFDISAVGTNVSHKDADANPFAGVSGAQMYRAGKTVPVISLMATF
jgi:uncharacterized protein (TIGR02001 family)